MSGYEYVKYLTAEVTTYLNLPPHLKKQHKLKKSQPLYSKQLFGTLPFMLKLFFFKK